MITQYQALTLTVERVGLGVGMGIEPNREPIALTDYHVFGVARAAWADTGLPRSAKPGGLARSGCQWDGVPLFFRCGTTGRSDWELRMKELVRVGR